MPNLIANYKEKVFVASARKSYSVVINAMNSWLAKNGTPGDFESFWFYSSDINVLAQVFAKELNSVKVCTNSDVDACGGAYDVRMPRKINDGHGNTDSELWIGEPVNRIVLADGSFLVLLSEVKNGSCTYQQWASEKDSNGFLIPDPSSPNGYKGKYYTYHGCGRIAYDTNGVKQPNQIGTDIFIIGFTSNAYKNADYDFWGNINYVLTNDKLIMTENYQTGKYE